MHAALQAGLHRLGASLSCFHEPQRCLRTLSQRRFGLFILDLNGQAEQGLAVLTGVRGIVPPLPPTAVPPPGLCW